MRPAREQVVVVTGAARGIGRATALRFAADGAKIAAWDASPLGTLDEEVAAAGGEALLTQVDVSSTDDVRSAVSKVLDRWQRLDVLINNAGVLRDAQLVKWRDGQAVDEMSDADFDDVLAVNLRGVFLCTRAVVPQMIRQGRGVILSATSVVAAHGNFGQTNYVASKTGVIGMTRTWARELGRHGIRVNAVAPGFIDTEMARQVPEPVLERVVAHTPLGRMGEPNDVAEAYAWLASDRARFVHGAVLAVDGGLVIGS